MDKIKVLVADDHPMFRTGIVYVLQDSGEFDIVGEAGNGQEVLQLMNQCRPEVILMDIHLPILNGIAASKEISKLFPDTKILALSHSNERDYVLNMIKAGATGYVLKEGTMDELKMAIKTLAKGNSYFSQNISSTLFAHLGGRFNNASLTTGEALDRLTERESQILQFVAEEFTNKEIAEKLFISPRTVETHKRNLIQKLKVKNAIGLVKYYLKTARRKDFISGNIH